MPIDPAKPFDLEYRVDPTWAGMRLDLFLKAMIPGMSRTKIQKYVRAERIEVNGTPRRANWTVQLGDRVLLRCNVPEEGADAGRHIPLEIVYEDEHLLAVNKQPGLVVHPVALHRHDTLLNALYWRYRDILPPEQEISLANRIDKDTSGLILVTKHAAAKRVIQLAFERREPKKAYLALVEGVPDPAEGTVDLPLGPAQGRTDRCLMGVRHDEEGKPSLSHYATLERFSPADGDRGFALVRLEPHTGRQHQLRVHMAAIGHPLVADVRYGDGRCLVFQTPGAEAVPLARFALHAAEIAFVHPVTGAPMRLQAPPPSDFAGAIEGLRAGWPRRRERG